jgi:hypothetical protein
MVVLPVAGRFFEPVFQTGFYPVMLGRGSALDQQIAGSRL